MDATNYALRAQIPLLVFLAEWVAGMAQGLTFNDIVRHKASSTRYRYNAVSDGNF